MEEIYFEESNFEDNQVKFHNNEIFINGNLEKIKEEFEKNPDKFNHGCYYTLAQYCHKEPIDYLFKNEFLYDIEEGFKHPYLDTFCEYATGDGDLDFIKWIFEEKKIPMLPGCYRMPFTYGWFEIIKYLVDMDCPFEEKTIIYLCESQEGDIKICREYFIENKLRYNNNILDKYKNYIISKDETTKRIFNFYLLNQ